MDVNNWVVDDHGAITEPTDEVCPRCGGPMTQSYVKLNFSYNQSWVPGFKSCATCPPIPWDDAE